MIDDLPTPLLFNLWKHHTGVLRLRIRDTPLAALPERLLVVGSELMDLYVGDLTPLQIGDAVLTQLRDGGVLDAEPFARWVSEAGGYRVVPAPQDGSAWVLRRAHDSRYVHVHPGRHTPHTRRVRANVLKTAVLVLAAGLDPRDVKEINRVRKTFLGLEPIRDLVAGQGLDALLKLLA